MAVFLQRVLPLKSPLVLPRGNNAGVNKVQTLPEYSVSSGAESVSSASMKNLDSVLEASKKPAALGCGLQLPF